MFSNLFGPFGSTLGAANTVGGSPPVITSPSSLVVGTVGTIYPTTTFTATGTAPITWSITSGTLPTGMSFSSGGVLSGTPTATASGSITFTATNAFGFDPRTLTLTVNAAGSGPAAITRFTLPGGTVGTPYSQQITATGTAPITFSVYDGVLPTGLSLDSSTGIISGTPSVGSSTQFIIQAVNGISQPDTQVKFVGYAVRVNPFVVAPYLIENAIPDCHTTVPYSQTFSATGDAPFTWSLTGSLPTGLSFNTATATISGTPTSTGVFSLSVSVSNASGTSTKTIALNSVAFSSNRVYGRDLTWIGAIRMPQTAPLFEQYPAMPSITVVPSQSAFYLNIRPSSLAGFPIAKMDLPAAVNSTNKNDLNTASFISSYFESSEGTYTNWTSGAAVNGIYWNSNKLYISASYFYLTNNSSPAVFSRSDALVTNGSVSGSAKINSTSRFYNGGFDTTPPSATTVGIPAIVSGGSYGSINSVLSNGPSLFAFNAGSLTTGTTNVVGNELIGYPLGTPLSSLYGWNDHQQNPYHQLGVTSYTGLAWIQSKPVLLVFGTHSLGQSWYGALSPGGARTVEPTNLNTTPGIQGGSSSKGNQSVEFYPYVWAYDQQDLIDVYNGTKLSNAIKPYDVWKLPIPSQYYDSSITANGGGTGGIIGQASHDPANKRIYVMVRNSEVFRPGFVDIYIPMLHVFSYP